MKYRMMYANMSMHRQPGEAACAACSFARRSIFFASTSTLRRLSSPKTERRTL